ncbi:bifunctional UDP-N-acetylglucosamine diphosphorylase/glucosamine-1-phosphate N-acetyltransferase GlmU [Clostridia bacterium OttesenSCG-928-F22]|nr:bifunctional UDP-N-acetylglucosamine diphosphorylase/glucosamine-1-phosphate N-acetyltransferase GlmU [Clostridia bacterium OttesenSCG-928-F22]
MKQVEAIILAAGEGKRMKSSLPKVLHPICGRTMVEHAMEAVKGYCEKPILVIGHGGETVQQKIGDRARYCYQTEQLGTGHAVMMAKEQLQGKQGYVVVMAGDMPLIHRDIIDALVQHAQAEPCGAVVLTGRMHNPTGYGRILRKPDGSIQAIVEEKDADELQKSIGETNSSIYCFDIASLLDCLDSLDNKNAQGEYYLTDCIELLNKQGKRVLAHAVEDVRDCMGINDREQLSYATDVMRMRIIHRHMQNGVTIIDKNNAYIDVQVEIGRDTVIYPGAVIEGNTKIGENCTIIGVCTLKDATIGSHVSIKSSDLEQCVVRDGAKLGPYVHIRPNSDIGENTKLGNFVEVKNSTLAEGAKVSHLTYVGDAEVGKDVNIGCGVVFVNYDGKHKYKTVVEDNAFIGCNTNLVAPVKVEKGAYIAAGSTITKDVPQENLAIARARQINRANWKIRSKE